MTDPGALLTREEIAEWLLKEETDWIYAGLRGQALIDNVLRFIDARLRPAWERLQRKNHATCEPQWSAEVMRKQLDALHAELRARDEEISRQHVTCDEHIAANENLKADLRACAEALETILPAVDTILRWIESHKRDLRELTDADLEIFRASVKAAHAALARPGVKEQ